jgi:quinol monooxygenase YgiN
VNGAVVARFALQALPGKEAQLLATLHETLRATRAFDGCLRVRVLVDDADPRRVTVLSEWASGSQHEAYIAWRAGDGAPVELPPLLAETPAAERLVARLEL